MKKRSAQGIENERERIRVNAKVNYDVMIADGRCYKCAEKCEINPKTNKPYHACKYHREEHDRLAKERKEKAGMAKLANALDLKSNGRKSLMGSIPSTRTIL